MSQREVTEALVRAGRPQQEVTEALVRAGRPQREATEVLLRASRRYQRAIPRPRAVSSRDAVETAIEMVKLSREETWAALLRSNPIGRWP